MADRRTVFRPRLARAVIYPCLVLVVGALVAGAVTLPSTGRHAWGTGSRLALVAFAALVAWFLHRLASVRVVADERGVTVVNILRSKRLEWAEIVGVRLLRDDAWMMLDLADGEAMAAMGVQKSDGAHAQEQARQFARLVNDHTRTARND